MSIRRFGAMGLLLAALCVGSGYFADAPRAATSTAGTDVSDIWWNPAESGWGMQLVQVGDFVFATVFIYGSDGKATWITGELSRTGAGVYGGPVYVSTGPYYGGGFNPAAVNSRAAGTMSFTLNSPTTGQVAYTVDGVAVSKVVERQWLGTDSYSGTYLAAVNLTATGCTSSADNENVVTPMQITITQAGGALTLVADAYGERCTYNGTYAQAGRFGTFNGTFTCNTGDTGTMAFLEMTRREGMLAGVLSGRSTNRGCDLAGRFAGIVWTSP